MNSKRIFLYTALTVLLSVLSARVSAQGSLEFNKHVHDFGDLLLSDGEQKCTFTYKNTGDKPVVIHNIVSSCGCTEPKWNKAPIMPGKSGEIEVTFLNDQGPYPFEKVLTVYTSSSKKPVLLKIRGVVHKKKRPLGELYPYTCGTAGFRMERLDMEHIVKDRSKTETFPVANLSQSPMKISFYPVPDGFSVVVPESIPPMSTASVSVTCDTKQFGENVWGRKNYRLPVTVNGKPSGSIEISVLVKPDFSDMPASKKAFGPMPVFKKSSYVAEMVKKGEKIVREFTFTNNGKEDFLIYAVDSSRPESKVTYPETPVKQGASATVKVEIDTADLPMGETLFTFTLVTNSPARPLVNLFVSVGII